MKEKTITLSVSDIENIIFCLEEYAERYSWDDDVTVPDLEKTQQITQRLVSKIKEQIK